jgi:hypothetical protein
MSPKLRPALTLAILIALAGPAGAQTNRSPDPAAKPKTDAVPITTPMIFYLAKGEPDACGQGCGEWIAAEGQFDPGAPQRLRTFLNRLGGRRLPIFFHSSGGLKNEAIVIGRLLRAREMTAGVSMTIPEGCVATNDGACRTLKQSGQKLAAELRGVGSCYSGCVYALVGAKVRQVSPGARLGVHSGRRVVVNPDGRVKFAPEDRALSRELAAQSDAQTRRYLQEMGIDSRLFALIAKTPYEEIHVLSRDEIAGFGIDKREHIETRWMAMESPSKPLSVSKLVVQAKGAERKEYRTSLIHLVCAGPQRIRVAYARGLASDETQAAMTIRLAFGDRALLLPEKGSVAKIDAIDGGGSFDTRFTHMPFEFFQAAATHDAIEVTELDRTWQVTSSVRLSTAGLASAISALRKTCGEPWKPDSPAATPLDSPGIKILDAPAVKLFDKPADSDWRNLR